MLDRIVDELNDAMGCLREDDRGYAYHIGKAGGIAAATGATGFQRESLCCEISSAYERLNQEEFPNRSDCIAQREEVFGGIISNLKAVPIDDTALDGRPVARIRWEEYGAALYEAGQAKAGGDELRHALMTGFVSGLMFRDPGPRYPEGSILQAIEEGYRLDRPERVQWAQERLSAAHRLSDSSPFMANETYDSYMKRKLQLIHWVQNFGQHGSHAEDDKVWVPNSMKINHFLRQQSQ